MIMRPIHYWFFYLGILFIATFNINWKPKDSLHTQTFIINTVNDTATFVFKPKFDKTYHYHYKAEKLVKIDCFIPDSIRFVNKEKNTNNKIIVTLKFRKNGRP